MSEPGAHSYARRVTREDYLSQAQEDHAAAHIRRLAEATETTTPPSENELAHLKRRAREAEHLLVRSHLRLVLSIAKRYHSPKVELDDLVQEGSLALIRAARLFPFRGRARFGSYARGIVHAAIGRAADLAGHPATVPERVLLEARRVSRVSQNLAVNGHAREREDLQWILNLSDVELLELEGVTATPMLLSTPVSEGTLTLGETLYYRSGQQEVGDEVEEAAIADDLRRQLSQAGLNERECAVVLLRHGIRTTWYSSGSDGTQARAAERLDRDRTFTEVGEYMNLSRAHASRTYEVAVYKLRVFVDERISWRQRELTDWKVQRQLGEALSSLATEIPRRRRTTAPEDLESWYINTR
jgi:RNA polymerase sigma factor (sigma-70 family)